MKYDFIFDSLRQYIAAAAPNFVMRDDLVRLEGRVDELLDIADSLEQKLSHSGYPGGGRSRSDGKRRPPRL